MTNGSAQTDTEYEELRMRLNTEELQCEVKALALKNVRLERRVEQLLRFIDKQEMQMEIHRREQGMDLEGVKGLEAHTSACQQCFRHRDMWRGMRAFNMDIQKKGQGNAVIEEIMQLQQKQDMDQMRIKHGRLQVKFDELKKQINDPLCRVSEIVQLRAEAEKKNELMERLDFQSRCTFRDMSAQIQCEQMERSELQDKVSSLEACIKMQQEKIDALETSSHDDSSESDNEGFLDDGGDLTKKPILSATGPDDELTARLQGQFEIVAESDQLETCENDLYDDFMSSQAPHLQEQILDRMFASCHNGQRMPEKERKRLRSKPNCRSCKNSFSACLRAMGGIMRKKESRKMWLNIRLKKRSGV